jgi:hypothetical protein
MPDNVKFIQNIVGSILDRIESFKNIFNWSVPSKVGFSFEPHEVLMSPFNP